MIFSVIMFVVVKQSDAFTMHFYFATKIVVGRLGTIPPGGFNFCSCSTHGEK
jgi:hypothetical protein